MRLAYKASGDELVTDQPRVPATGIVTGFLCTGERDYEHRFDLPRPISSAPRSP